MDVVEVTSAKRRYETFCDCFLALVLVSSALQLRLPEDMATSSPLRAGAELWGALGVYALNFYTVGILWTNQRKLTRSLPEIPGSVVVIMLGGLAVVGLTPLTTGNLAADPLSKEAILLFAAGWAAVALAMTIARLRLRHIYPTNADVATVHDMVTYRGIAAMLIYAGAIPLSQLSPTAALVALVLAPSLFLVREGRRARWGG